MGCTTSTDERSSSAIVPPSVPFDALVTVAAARAVILGITSQDLNNNNSNNVNNANQQQEQQHEEQQHDEHRRRMRIVTRQLGFRFQKDSAAIVKKWKHFTAAVEAIEKGKQQQKGDKRGSSSAFLSSILSFGGATIHHSKLTTAQKKERKREIKSQRRAYVIKNAPPCEAQEEEEEEEELLLDNAAGGESASKKKTPKTKKTSTTTTTGGDDQMPHLASTDAPPFVEQLPPEEHDDTSKYIGKLLAHAIGTRWGVKMHSSRAFARLFDEDEHTFLVPPDGDSGGAAPPLAAAGGLPPKPQKPGASLSLQRSKQQQKHQRKQKQREEGFVDPFWPWKRMLKSGGLDTPTRIKQQWTTDEEFGRQQFAGVHPFHIQRILPPSTRRRKGSDDKEEVVDGGIPQKFRVTPQQVEQVLREHYGHYFKPTEEDGGNDAVVAPTFDSMLRRGRLFMTDYALLDGLPAPVENNCCAPMALFALVDTEKKVSSGKMVKTQLLLPLAIQLFQGQQEQQQKEEGEKTSSSSSHPVFTPCNCSEATWLMCKIHCQVADGFVMEVATHLVLTHFIPESSYICLRRNVSVQHPLMLLLAPHFAHTMSINWWSRRDLVASGRAVPRLMVGGLSGTRELVRRAWVSFDVSKQWDYERCFRDKGFLPSEHEKEQQQQQEEKKEEEDDEHKLDALQHFYARDDALELWGIVGDYVRDVTCSLYEHNDWLLIQDDEVQAWGRELHQRGLLTGFFSPPQENDLRKQETEEAEASSLPLIFDCLDTLVRYLHRLLYASCVGHSVVNNGQWDFFGFVPNKPGKFGLPPPTAEDLRHNANKDEKRKKKETSHRSSSSPCEFDDIGGDLEEPRSSVGGDKRQNESTEDDDEENEKEHFHSFLRIAAAMPRHSDSADAMAIVSTLTMPTIDPIGGKLVWSGGVDEKSKKRSAEAREEEDDEESREFEFGPSFEEELKKHKQKKEKARVESNNYYAVAGSSLRLCIDDDEDANLDFYKRRNKQRDKRKKLKDEHKAFHKRRKSSASSTPITPARTPLLQDHEQRQEEENAGDVARFSIDEACVAFGAFIAPFKQHFDAELARMTCRVEQRNSLLEEEGLGEWCYTYLDPAQIGRSVAL